MTDTEKRIIGRIARRLERSQQLVDRTIERLEIVSYGKCSSLLNVSSVLQDAAKTLRNL